MWWRKFRSTQAEWRWLTRPRNGYNSHNGTSSHGETSVKAEQAGQIHTIGMWWRSWLLPWEREEVRDGWIVGSGRCSPTVIRFCRPAALTTFEKDMETVDVVPAKSQQLQAISRHQGVHISLGCFKPQSHKHIGSLPSNVVSKVFLST